MRRSILSVPAVLIVLVACRDGPDELVAPLESRAAAQPDVTVLAEAVTTVEQLLDDPFVWELMEGVGADAEALQSAARDASISRTTEHVLTLSRVLAQTQSGLLVRADGEEDPDDDIFRAVLALMLDDAAALLEPPPRSAEDEPRGRDTTRNRRIER